MNGKLKPIFCEKQENKNIIKLPSAELAQRVGKVTQLASIQLFSSKKKKNAELSVKHLDAALLAKKNDAELFVKTIHAELYS